MNEMKMLRDHHGSRPDPTPTAVAQARARLTSRAGSKPVRSRRRRYAVVAMGVAGVAAAAVIAPVVLGGDHADKAYAVERLPNGTIKVTLREFVDSAGLQRKLNAMGVRVVVDYLPRGTRCADEPRGALVQSPQPQVVENDHTHNPDPGPIKAGDFTSYIRTERIKPGQTLVWVMSYDRGVLNRDRGFTVSTMAYLARGPVKPCTPTQRPWHRSTPPA